jgi:hypothetical protein
MSWANCPLLLDWVEKVGPELTHHQELAIKKSKKKNSGAPISLI